MGVPRIQLEQAFGPFGEKPGGPFSVHAQRAWRQIRGDRRNDEKGTDISHHSRAGIDNRDAVKIVYNDAGNG